MDKFFYLCRLNLIFILIIEGCSTIDAPKTPKNSPSTSSTPIALNPSTIDKLFPSDTSKTASPPPQISQQPTPTSTPIPVTPPVEPSVTSPDIQQIIGAKIGWNKDLKINDVFYDLYIPPNYGSNPSLPSILVLPGWNFPRTSWVTNSRLVDYAKQYGYALILPEMGKTLYESAYYPQTTLKWNAVPGGQFIKSRLLPRIQRKHNLLKPGQYNTLLGLSTGGRGVALIALENPGIFAAGASLSGDFSQENTPQDRLMTAVYGSYSQFPQRWQGQDNPQSRVNEWRMPLYLAHGMADKVVPESQSRLFYQALKTYQGERILISYYPVQGAGHDYQFWGGQLPYVFQFFEQNK